MLDGLLQLCTVLSLSFFPVSTVQQDIVEDTGGW